MMNNNKKDNRKNNNEKDLDELVNVALEKDENDSEEEDYSPKVNIKKPVLITVAAMTIFSIGLFIASKNLQPQEFESIDKKPPVIQSSNSEDKKKENKRIDKYIAEEKDSKKNPIEEDIKSEVKEEKTEEDSLISDYNELPAWMKEKFNEESLSDEDRLEEIMSLAGNIHQLELHLSMIPTKNAGFTNNFDERRLDNGAHNLMYSYALREDYKKAYIVNAQKLLNPIFGNWEFAQLTTPTRPLKQESIFEVFRRSFTQDWWNKNIKDQQDYTALPILADWNGDSFGGLEFADRVTDRYGTWFGITDGEIKVSELENKDKRGQPIIATETPVKYRAFGIDGKILEKTGTLKLEFRSNENIGDINNRVVISNASLKMN